MDLGLNGLGMSADDLLAVRERGWKLVRFTTWSLGDDAARIGSAIAEARLAGLWPVVVVRDAGQLRDLGTALAGCDVELANEPDGNVDVHIPPTDYAEMARNAAVIAYENGCQLWIGAISNVSGSALAWLEKMLEALGPVPVIGISAHVYEARIGRGSCPSSVIGAGSARSSGITPGSSRRGGAGCRSGGRGTARPTQTPMCSAWPLSGCSTFRRTARSRPVTTSTGTGSRLAIRIGSASVDAIRLEASRRGSRSRSCRGE